jgi:hypothetical protein
VPAPVTEPVNPCLHLAVVARRFAATFVVCAAIGAGPAVACAQGSRHVTPVSAWTTGAFAGLWDRVPTRSETGRKNGAAFDATVQRRIGPALDAGASSIRLDVGRGTGTASREPGFDYRRLLVGLERPLTTASQPPGARLHF